MPQARTEALLQQRLLELSTGALMRGHRCEGLTHEDASVRVRLSTSAGERTLDAQFVVGCDGKYSAVRRALRIQYQGSAYPDHFLMGDLPDETGYGPDAAVFLHPEGLVESFPLPGLQRRWVVATGDARMSADADLLAALVARRSGHSLRAAQASLVSAFTAEHYLARCFARDRAMLAGDAAHVVSPIGGQGMNLGWLDASALSPLLAALLHGKADPSAALSRYSRSRRRAAKAAIGRAELFMGIGRGRSKSSLRESAVRALLRPELRPLSARLFTMWRI